MGISEPGRRCKNHPHHLEKLGVCPSCLREKLSRLSSASYKEAINSRVAPSSSPSLSFSPVDRSSASSSNPASPARHRNLHKRNGSAVIGMLRSSSFIVKVGANGLKKSRSIAFVPGNFDGEEAKNGKKKKGFWSKLLRFKGKNKDVLTHSTSMRMIERVNLVS